MKTLYAFFAFMFVFVGCFTGRSITRDELIADEEKVTFYLTDGTSIRSYGEHHMRIQGGYRVSGTLFQEHKSPERFDGLISDTSIKSFRVEKFSPVSTVLGVGIAVMVIGGALLVAAR